MIRRNVYTEGILRVEYELTPIGEKFRTVLQSIEKWGNEYITYLKAKNASTDNE